MWQSLKHLQLLVARVNFNFCCTLLGEDDTEVSVKKLSLKKLTLHWIWSGLVGVSVVHEAAVSSTTLTLTDRVENVMQQ